LHIGFCSELDFYIPSDRQNPTGSSTVTKLQRKFRANVFRWVGSTILYKKLARTHAL